MNELFYKYGGLFFTLIFWIFIYFGIFGGIVYMLAKKYGRNPLRWVAAGLFLNLLGTIAILVYIGEPGKMDEDKERQTIVIGFVIAFIIQTLIIF